MKSPVLVIQKCGYSCSIRGKYPCCINQHAEQAIQGQSTTSPVNPAQLFENANTVNHFTLEITWTIIMY